MATATMRLEVALALGPYDPVGDGDWTDLSDRLLEVHRRAGREDASAEFEAATIVVVLDNDDRLLDPDHPPALNYRHDGLGMPLCPVRLSIDYDGENWPLFTGYLGPECWAGDTARVGSAATVTLNAFDRRGLAEQMDGPGGLWDLITAFLGPEWWLTGAAGFPFLGDGTELVNGGPTGGAAVVSAPPGKIVAMTQPNLAPGSVYTGSMRFGEGVEVISPSALVMPDGASSGGTAMVFWSGDPAATQQGIMRMESDGGTLRWEVVCTTAGAIVCVIYDSAGTPINLVAAVDNVADGSGGRWDDGQPHVIILRITGGGDVALRTEAGEVTMDSPPLDQVRTSRLILGPSVGVTRFDQLMWWNRALSDAEVSVPVIWLGTGLGPFRGDSLPQRLAHIYKINGLDPSDDSSEWHSGVDDDLGGVGMQEMYNTNTMGGDLTATVESWGGVWWATRAGRIRARSVTALDNPAHAADYVTPTVHLTDEPDPDPLPLPVRRSKLSFSGVRGDRIVNSATIQFFYGQGGAFEQFTSAEITYTDGASIARYGRRDVQMSTTVVEWPWAALLARRMVERHAQPPIEIQAVTLWPLVDAAAMEWLVTGCELERAVQVTHTPAIGDPVELLLNVQGETWDWVAGTDFRVVLNLAPS